MMKHKLRIWIVITVIAFLSIISTGCAYKYTYRFGAPPQTSFAKSETEVDSLIFKSKILSYGEEPSAYAVSLGVLALGAAIYYWLEGDNDKSDLASCVSGLALDTQEECE